MVQFNPKKYNQTSGYNQKWEKKRTLAQFLPENFHELTPLRGWLIILTRVLRNKIN